MNCHVLHPVIKEHGLIISMRIDSKENNGDEYTSGGPPSRYISDDNYSNEVFIEQRASSMSEKSAFSTGESRTELPMRLAMHDDQYMHGHIQLE